MTKNEHIHNYINNHLLNGVYPEESVGKLWSKNGICIFMYLSSHNILYVKKNVWNELCNMFSLTENDTNGLFRGWAIRNLGLPNSIMVTYNDNFS